MQRKLKPKELATLIELLNLQIPREDAIEISKKCHNFLNIITDPEAIIIQKRIEELKNTNLKGKKALEYLQKDINPEYAQLIDPIYNPFNSITLL